ncbi:MAG: hypothetical protein PHY14_03230 [Candidatus Gracilibacteria bacterium]|nr:hypothetical protein [Candidatus Gracilibacteria bacterium]
MTQEIQNTSEVGAEKGGCAEACACLECISHIAKKIDEGIAGMDTVDLSRSAFRIQNSSVFRKLGELRDEERMCRMDKIYIQGIDIISELLMKRDKAVGFVLLDGILLSDNEHNQLIADWMGFFHRMIAEKKSVHMGKDYNLRLSIRIVGESSSFVLEKIRVNTDI